MERGLKTSLQKLNLEEKILATNSTTVNPTNAPPKEGQALPFIKTASGKAYVKPSKPADNFKAGLYPDEGGAPLLVTDPESKVVKYAPFASIRHGVVDPPTKEEIEALSRMDETSQTQTSYLKEAIVMDVDAKLILSTVPQMKVGHFREAHYPTLTHYMKSEHYKRFREARIVAERLTEVAKSTKLKESAGGIHLNPRLTGLLSKIDGAISKRLKESGFDKEIKRLKEDAFSIGETGPTWDGGQGTALAGRPMDFTPLMAGPYNKQLYFFDYLDMHSKAFQAWTHNPVAKRIVKVYSQFVLGKGVKLTVIKAVTKDQENQSQSNNTSKPKDLMKMAQRISRGQVQSNKDWKKIAQGTLDMHWMKNSLHIRSKQILRDLIIFGEQFIRYYDAPWGLRLRSIDPSTVWEVVTDPDDAEMEFYLHQQYPTKYQTFVDLPIPTIKFIIRQVPALHYFHMKINSTAGEVRGRSELFAILGWLKRLKEYASDRVIRNKMANLFVLDVSVEGSASDVAAVQAQMATPPTPGSFFFHNKAAELNSVEAKVGASDTQGDWEMLLTIIGMGAGISQEYLGMSAGGGKAQSLVGTEPDIKSFEDYQELMEEFYLQDAQRVFNRAKDRGELPRDLMISVEVTYPELAGENRSEKLKDFAFMESMSWVSHRRVASAAAKEMQMTSYDYDDEQIAIAQEDATQQYLINTAYQQIPKGEDSSSAGGSGGGGTSSGSSGKGASGMGPGKALPTSSKKSTGESDGIIESLKESDEDEDEDTAPGTSTYSRVSGFATTHNASDSSDKRLPWRGGTLDESTGRKDRYRGQDPRDVASSIKREATNLRYERRAIGRRNDRIQTPDKIRDQKSRQDVVGDARKALKSGNLGHESSKNVQRFPREREGGPGSGRHKSSSSHEDDKEIKFGGLKGISNPKIGMLKYPNTSKLIDAMMNGNIPPQPDDSYNEYINAVKAYLQEHPNLIAKAEMAVKRMSNHETDILGYGEESEQQSVIKKYGEGGRAANTILNNCFDPPERYYKSKESMSPFKQQDGDKIQKPRVQTVPDHEGIPRKSI